LINGLYTFYIKIGQESAFHEVIGKAHKAFVQAEFPGYYLWSNVRSGGNVSSIMAIIPHPNWADFEEPEDSEWSALVEVYGPEEAKALVEKFNNAVWKVESMVLQYRPDLSYTPEQ